jgi:hypothetical protein
MEKARATWRTMTVKARARLVSWYILGGGLASALILYLVVPEAEDDRMKDVVESRRYLHDLEAMGGKVNVLQDQFSRWFMSLWYGKQLAVTVAWLSVFVFLAINLILAQNRFDERARTGATSRVDGQGEIERARPEAREKDGEDA